jgi:SRSO17 transposase
MSSLPNSAADPSAVIGDAYQRIAPYFARSETRARASSYLVGLLSATERKNGWQLAEFSGEAHPRGIQRLLDEAEWDVDVVRDALRQYVVEHLGQPGGVLIVDETGFLKKGTKSAGVARQYSGTAGRRENQQIGVFVAYASESGCAFIDRELYVPQEWLRDPARCREAGIPATRAFATKPQLAQQMLARAFAAAVPARWVVGDCVYGAEELRQWLQAEGQAYVFAVTSTHAIWEQGQQLSVVELVERHPELGWVRWSAGEGSQGPRRYDWAWMRLPYTSAPGMAHWLLIRRSLSLPEEYAYYRVYGPEATALPELVAVAGQRWPIEAAFEEAKGEVGLDHYEVRLWLAWYRHITLALLAHAALVVARNVSATAKKGT